MPQGFPKQHQDQQPGIEEIMHPAPQEKGEWYKGSGKLLNKIALITGGDSGIGRSVAILFAREGADIAVVYCNEHEDAAVTKKMVEDEGRRCILTAGDIATSAFCRDAVRETISAYSRLDIVVNNAAYQPYQNDAVHFTDEQLERTFHTNIFSFFYMVRESIPHLTPGSCIINTTSITAYRGSPHLLDYSATKGAIVSFTRSLSLMLVEKGIRVNGVAPGPVWTPLIPSSFPAEKMESFGTSVPMRRAAQPQEIAPCYVFLASRDSSYMSGQVLHPNGGYIVNG